MILGEIDQRGYPDFVVSSGSAWRGELEEKLEKASRQERENVFQRKEYLLKCGRLETTQTVNKAASVEQKRTRWESWVGMRSWVHLHQLSSWQECQVVTGYV